MAVSHMITLSKGHNQNSEKLTACTKELQYKVGCVKVQLCHVENPVNTYYDEACENDFLFIPALQGSLGCDQGA